MTAGTEGRVSDVITEGPRKRILDAARDLFYREGTRAVGINRIIADAGVAKATFYEHFAGKDELVQTYVEDRDARSLALLRQRVAEAASGLDAEIDACFAYLRDRVTGAGFRGCGMMLVYGDQRGSERVRAAVRRHKLAVRAVFADILRRHAVADADRRADQLLILYEGTMATAAVASIDDAVVAARAAATAIVGRPRSSGRTPSAASRS